MGVEQLVLPASVRNKGREPPRAHPLGSDVVALILVGFVYFTLASLGLRLASINPSATPIWPPTGLAIAAILLWGYRIAPAIFIGAFLINQLTAGSVFTSLAIACGNTLEAVIAGYLVSHWAEGEQVFDTPTGIAKFTLISLAATLVSATIGVSSLSLAGYAEVNSLISVWLTWWLGDFSGALVVAPVVVLWARSEPASLTPPQITGTGLTYLAAVAVGVLAFSPVLQQTPARDALFLAVLPLLWVSLCRGPRDTATVALIISTFAVWGTLMHGGPFAKPSLNDSFILLLAFMISTAVLSLALSTDVAVRHRIENQQRQRALLERQQGHEQQRQAVAISDALNLTTIRSDALEATLNALTSGVYLTDRHGRIVYMNRAAKRQVDTSNAIRVANNHLSPIDRAARLALAKAMNEATGDEAGLPTSGFTIALPGGDNSGLIATILPLARGERQSMYGAFSGMVAIFVQDPIVMPSFPGQAFAELYGLTSSELRVLLAMAPGLSVKEAPEMLGIGENTVKTHLQHIHSKTGTSKQTELVHLFLRSTPPVNAGQQPAGRR